MAPRFPWSRVIASLTVATLLLVTQLVAVRFAMSNFIALIKPRQEPAFFIVFLAAQMIQVLSAFLASTEFVRIGLLPTTDVAHHSVALLSSWSLPPLFCFSGLAIGNPALALLGHLSGVLVATIGAEATNLASDVVLVPSPGRTIARVLQFITSRH